MFESDDTNSFFVPTQWTAESCNTKNLFSASNSNCIYRISASYAIVFLFTPEIFPTNIRNTTVGAVDAVARIGKLACCVWKRDLLTYSAFMLTLAT